MSYDFIPFPEKVHRCRRRGMTLAERLDGHFFGSVQLRYRCRQPVHVGSGYKRLDGGRVVREMTRQGDTPVIPGSSMKGIFRSRYEAITKSCALQAPVREGRTVSVRSRSRPEVRRGKLTRQAQGEDVFRACRHMDAVCPACALFGFQSGRAGQRSRVSVSDFMAVDGAEVVSERMPAQYSPRLHYLGKSEVKHIHGEQVFEVGPLHGRKFATDDASDGGALQGVEALPADAVVAGTVRFFNLTAAELGGLLAAFGIEPQMSLKVGGGKGLGFGRVVLEGAPTWHLKDAMRVEQPEALDGWRAVFVGSDDYWECGEERMLQLRNSGGQRA